jgi:hypothetical protein
MSGVSSVKWGPPLCVHSRASILLEWSKGWTTETVPNHQAPGPHGQNRSVRRA